MQTVRQEKLVRSKPTRCVKCRIINEMTHLQSADLKTGGWTCSQCGHLYRFAHWKIQQAGKAFKAA
jgi:RNase P subunit RPR2